MIGGMIEGGVGGTYCRCKRWLTVVGLHVTDAEVNDWKYSPPGTAQLPVYTLTKAFCTACINTSVTFKKVKLDFVRILCYVHTTLRSFTLLRPKTLHMSFRAAASCPGAAATLPNACFLSGLSRCLPVTTDCSSLASLMLRASVVLRYRYQVFNVPPGAIRG